MVSRLRTASSRLSRKRISYRETSSNDGTDDSQDELGNDTDNEHPVPTRSRPKRKRSRPSRTPATVPQRSTKSRRKAPVSYKEPSSDGSSDDSYSEGETQSQAVRPARDAKQRLRKRDSPPVKALAYRNKSTCTGVTPNKHPEINISKVESDGNIPDWRSLPYEILLNIFTFASHPLYNENFAASSSIPWLLSTGRLCRAFAEPAITALYRCPPLLTMDKPHRLLDLLSQSPESHMFKYGVKIKRLELDVRSALAYTATGRGLFDLGSIIPYLPQLSELVIRNSIDNPGFRQLGLTVRWAYPDSLFHALENTGQRLREWAWNARLTGKTQDAMWMRGVHGMQSFQRLKKVTFTNYEGNTKRAKASEVRLAEELLADAISGLPHLESLTFGSSSVVNKKFLPLLPDNLRELTIINCASLSSEPLHTFLVSHGSQLRELVLNHNQTLDISFLPDLKASCPHLEVFKMDMTYYNTHATHNDSEPKFERLLQAEEVPTWPSTLRTIELLHLRKWDSAAAEAFFGSLLEAAEDLPDLRTLVLKATLNISWRDRADFRDKWIGRFQRTFLRKSTPPNPHLTSLRAFRTWKESQMQGPLSNSRTLSYVGIPTVNDSSDSDTPLLVRRTRRTDVKVVESLPTPQDDNDEGPAWKRRRLRPRKTASQEGSAADTAASEQESAVSRDSSNTREQFIHGMCEVVDIRIDNLRPRESQFNEADFLDSEPSSDEDWNGNDDIPGTDGYAW